MNLVSHNIFDTQKINVQCYMEFFFYPNVKQQK